MLFKRDVSRLLPSPSRMPMFGDILCLSLSADKSSPEVRYKKLRLDTSSGGVTRHAEPTSENTKFLCLFFPLGLALLACQAGALPTQNRLFSWPAWQMRLQQEKKMWGWSLVAQSLHLWHKSTYKEVSCPRVGSSSEFPVGFGIPHCRLHPRCEGILWWAKQLCAVFVSRVCQFWKGKCMWKCVKHEWCLLPGFSVLALREIQNASSSVETVTLGLLWGT